MIIGCEKCNKTITSSVGIIYGYADLPHEWHLPVSIHSDNAAESISEFRNGRPVAAVTWAGECYWTVAVCFAPLSIDRLSHAQSWRACGPFW